ncbi:MAG: glycosyltransferase [Pseudomonadota bacterium]
MTCPYRPCILIPTYNHTEALPGILAHLETLSLPVIIVDDGSEADKAARIDALVARNQHVSCHRHPENLGKGAAVLTGLAQVAEAGYSHALQIDADGQHELAAVERFLEMAKVHPEAVIAGQPVFDQSIPRSRRLGRKFTDFWVVIHTLSRHITDSMCGFRVYPLEAALAIAANTRIGRRMDFDTDILVRLFWRGTPIIMQPVRVTYPEENFSNFRMREDNVAISWMHTKLFFGMLRRLPILAFRPVPQTLHGQPRTSSHWARQAERGAQWGLPLLARIYRLFGRRVCLMLIAPAVLYFYATGKTQRAASKLYLGRVHKLAGRPGQPGRLASLWHFFSFAKAMLDMFAAWSGNIPVAAIQGVERGSFADAKAAGQGLLIVTAHLGNPEVIRAVATRNKRWRVNVLVHTLNAERFNRLIAQFAPEAPVRLIQVTDLGLDSVFLLQEAIDRGEWVVSVADRIPVGPSTRVSRLPFLGEPAPFPQGPFILASLLKCPIYTMFCLCEGHGYRVVFDKLMDRLELPRATREARLREAMQEFVTRLEDELRQEPLQWYNFYDFWNPALPASDPNASLRPSNPANPQFAAGKGP